MKTFSAADHVPATSPWTVTFRARTSASTPPFSDARQVVRAQVDRPGDPAFDHEVSVAGDVSLEGQALPDAGGSVRVLFGLVSRHGPWCPPFRWDF